MLLKKDGGKGSDPTQSAAEKVDCLINRMDRFMDCFTNLLSTLTKNQYTNDLKFKRLELAHNNMVTTVVNSANSTENKLVRDQAQ